MRAINTIILFSFTMACGLIALWRALANPRLRNWLLPPPRRRAVPWGAGEVLLAAFSTLIFWGGLWNAVLDALGFFPWLYGPDAEPSATQRQLWVFLFVFPCATLSIPILFHLLSGTRPYQLGLTLHRAGRNALLGFVAWIVLTPLCYLILFVFTKLQGRGEEHPLTRLTETHTLPVEWLLAVFTAVVAAPVQEELLFRGVLQPWLARRRWGGTAAMAAALGLALLLRSGKLCEALWTGDSGALFTELLPTLFVLAMLPAFALVQWFSYSPAPAAIFGTSLLFAATHSFAWPSPVVLFPLGLGLGLLAYRTQTLVAPIVLHALFNAIGSVVLLLQLAAPPPDAPKGSETTSAVRVGSSPTISSRVPGS